MNFIRRTFRFVLRWRIKRRRQNTIFPKVETTSHMGCGPRDLVIILDGTLARLDEGCETNAGLVYRLLCKSYPDQSGRLLYYEEGIQWQGWLRIWDVITGRGINRQIMRAYGWLASHYRPGDRIFFFGYSRGAYAVRSLAGLIDRVGLLRRDAAIERHIRQAYRLYQSFDADSSAIKQFSKHYCHEKTPIEMVGVWDTVKALGVWLPGLWMISSPAHCFHNHHLGPSIRHGFHALALDETRVAFKPVLWACPNDWDGHVEQMWFRGAHPDIGGHVGERRDARPLSNIPLVWMLERAQRCGLELECGWRREFSYDSYAPMVGTWRGWGKLFLLRRARKVGEDQSENIHISVFTHFYSDDLLLQEELTPKLENTFKTAHMVSSAGRAGR